MGGVNGSRECATDDELRETHRMGEWESAPRARPSPTCSNSPATDACRQIADGLR
jgi:hypothetical protein